MTGHIWLTRFLAGAVFVVAGVIFAAVPGQPPIGTPALAQSKAGKAAAQSSGSAIPGLMEHSFAPVLERALPGVVSIRAKGTQDSEQLAILSNPIYSALLASDMVPSSAKQQAPKGFTSNGSGVIVDAAAGLVITNYHVIESATDIKVRLNDGREFTAELLGQDPAIDIAALRIKAHRLTAVPLGDSSDTRIGDLVFAIGNPLGLDSTATLGMVSALRRTAVGYRNFEAYIQHDASVNSGNSGGALLNLRGELIGINTAIVSPSGGSVGLGFAVPIGAAQRIWAQLVKHGKVQRGHLGLKTTDMRTDLFDTYGLATTQGAFILQTQAGSPAEVARLEFADVVTGYSVLNPLNGQWVRIQIQRAAQLEATMAVSQIGEEVRLEVRRGFDTYVVPVKVANIRPVPETLEVPPTILRLAGVVVQPLGSDNPVFGKIRGVEIVDVKRGTLAELAGLLKGDVMVSIDRDRIRTIEDVVELTKDKKEKFDISIVRDGKPLKIQYPL
jgi:Do/DeqQ family serine protease